MRPPYDCQRTDSDISTVAAKLCRQMNTPNTDSRHDAERRWATARQRTQRIGESEPIYQGLSHTEVAMLKKTEEQWVASLAKVDVEVAKACDYVKELVKKVEQYRDWWLSDHVLLDVVLDHLPQSELSQFEHVVTSSRARYEAFRACGSG